MSYIRLTVVPLIAALVLGITACSTASDIVEPDSKVKATHSATPTPEPTFAMRSEGQAMGIVNKSYWFDSPHPTFRVDSDLIAANEVDIAYWGSVEIAKLPRVKHVYTLSDDSRYYAVYLELMPKDSRVIALYMSDVMRQLGENYNRLSPEAKAIAGTWCVGMTDEFNWDDQKGRNGDTPEGITNPREFVHEFIGATVQGDGVCYPASTIGSVALVPAT